jgi:glycerophosphoryl diester phosphodiesterase
VIGHRGSAARAPENTLPGLRRARAEGCLWVEFDVRLTADRQLILLHDDTLRRTTNGKGRASALPLAAIRRLDAGSWFHPSFAGEKVPTLEEALSVLDEEGLGANIEVKATRVAASRAGAILADTLSRLSPSRRGGFLVSSFHAKALLAVRERAPALPRGILVRGAPRNWARRALSLGCASIHADERRLDPSIVAEIRASGYFLLAYTVNDPLRARRLFEWGVTSVFSDFPHAILGAVVQRECAVPARSEGAQG